MIKKFGGIAIACVLLTALTLVSPTSAVNAWQSPAHVMMVTQDAGKHTQYMEGSNGRFNPERPVSRAELAQMLSRIVADEPADAPQFYDVSADAWYAPAVAKAAGLGLMVGDYGYFQPDSPATRAECAYALSQLLPYDVPIMNRFWDIWPGYWAYQAICRTAGQGLFQGDDAGNFRPEDGLRRCEAVAVFNRLLGRTPDEQVLAAHPGLSAFSDVPSSHWAYGEIMEATMTHQYIAVSGGESWLLPETEEPAAPAVPATDAAGLPDGPQRINGRLYWVVNEKFARSCSMNGLHFNENGCYTTGNAELDDRLNAIVDELTNDSMTRDEKLRVLFNYCRDKFKYLKRPLISKGQTGWEPDYALYFLKNGKGNCYNFSAAYCLLCRELGLPAYTVVGSALNSPHGWVEIVLDGTIYLFDPQLAWRYLHDWGKSGYNFFKQPITKTTVKYTW